MIQKRRLLISARFGKLGYTSKKAAAKMSRRVAARRIPPEALSPTPDDRRRSSARQFHLSSPRRQDESGRISARGLRWKTERISVCVKVIYDKGREGYTPHLPPPHEQGPIPSPELRIKHDEYGMRGPVMENRILEDSGGFRLGHPPSNAFR